MDADLDTTIDSSNWVVVMRNFNFGKLGRTVRLKQIQTALVVLGALLAPLAQGEVVDWRAAYASTQASAEMDRLDVEQRYALGISRYDLDSHTDMIGWQLSNSVFFGRQGGEESGIALVWQREASQVSLSKEGLRLTRRF